MQYPGHISPGFPAKLLGVPYCPAPDPDFTFPEAGVAYEPVWTRICLSIKPGKQLAIRLQLVAERLNQLA